jgi:glycosyltransferase involved in cell wall biosynthesis
MFTEKRISIVVLTWNRKRLLRDCLDSLQKQRYQRDKLEIIVSDDGSTDGTDELVRHFQEEDERIKYVYQTHKGIAAARNRGICQAGGEIIAIVADDYILDTRYAETISWFFDQHRQAMVVRFRVIAARDDLASRISHFYFDASIRRRLSPAADYTPSGFKNWATQVWQKNPPFTDKIRTRHRLDASGAAAFRRDVFAKVGLFDESLRRAEDSDMTKRLREAGIEVHYYPFHEIKHQYGPLLVDTISKCFQTGFNRWKFYQKHKLWPRKGETVFTSMLLGKVGVLFDGLQRARQAETILQFLFYLPFMFLFELANKVGFVCGLVCARRPPSVTAARRVAES